jgi:hypothetical protein
VLRYVTLFYVVLCYAVLCFAAYFEVSIGDSSGMLCNVLFVCGTSYPINLR